VQLFCQMVAVWLVLLVLLVAAVLLWRYGPVWTSLRAKFYCFVLGRPDVSFPEFVWSGKTGSAVLVVAFAGGANLVGGIPRLEFGATLASMGLDHVLVLDWKQTWYVHTEASIRAKLAPVARQYERVCFVGNCMGATGALLMADLADVVVAFAPLTSLNCATGQYGLNARWRIERSIRDTFEQRLSEAVDRCRQCVHVYYTPEKDTAFAAWAPKGARVTMTPLGNPRKLRDRGLLVRFLQEHFDHSNNRGTRPCQFVSTIL
jgi:hypothetical protein